jgi:hypothetical protein
MNKNILKNNLHQLIDLIENQHLLENYYKEIKYILEKYQDNVWDKLTDEQKNEVILSFEESEVEANLVSNESVMNKYKNWL